MILSAIALLVLATRGGDSKDIKTGQQPIVVCSNPPRLYADPENCRKYLQCVNRKPKSMFCPSKTVFDPAMQICIWREDINNCTSDQHETATDVIRIQNRTRNIHVGDAQNGLAESSMSRSTLNKRSLRPTPYFSTAASSKQKIGKTEMAFSVNKIENTVADYIKPRSGHATTSSAVEGVSVAHTIQPNRQNVDLSSATMATASVKPANMASHPVVIAEPGNKWYHAMNSVATTTTASTLYGDRSQTMSTASSQGYQTHQNAESRMYSSDRKLSGNRNTDPNDGFIKQNPTDDASDRRHFKYNDSDNAKKNISNLSLGSITHLRNGSNLENKAERSEDNNEGGAERNQGLTSISVEGAQNATAEADNSKLIDVFGNEGNNDTDISAWAEHVPQDVVEGARSQPSPGTLGIHGEFPLSLQPPNMLENTTHVAQNAIPHVSRNDVEQTTKTSQISDVYVVPHESRNAVDETTRPSQTAGDNSREKEVNIPKAAPNDTTLTEVENSSTDNISFEDVAKLIAPYRVRLDRKSIKGTPEIPGDDVDASPTEFEENTISIEEMWTRDEVKFLPSLFEHLTAKIVNRDLLVPEFTKKSRWYDKKHAAVMPVRTTTPHTDNTDYSWASRVESEQHMRAEKDHFLAPSNTALVKSSVGNGSKSQRVRDEQTTHRTRTAVTTPAVPTPATKRSPVVETTTNRKLVSTTESNADALSGLPVTGTGVAMPARSVSAPYLATGLARPFRCPERSGHFADAGNCAVYYLCVRGQALKRECAPGEVFHASVKSCVPSSLVPPCSNAYADAVQEDESFARSVCKDPNGLYRDNVSCAHYFECTNGWPIRRQCMMGTVFDDVMRKCSWSKFVPGCEHQTTPEVEINTPGTGHTKFQCPRDGYFRDPQSCHVYYLCAGNQALRMTCDSGTSFDVTLNMCAWSHLVDDCKDKKGQMKGDGENTVGVMTVAKTDYTNANIDLDTPESPQQDFQCPEKNGVFPLQEDCGVYYVCADGLARKMNCPEGLGYDLASGLCLEVGQLPQCASPTRYQAPREDTTPFSCPEAHGLYSDSSNCSFFIHCFKKLAYRHECQPGTAFSPANAACTWSQLVPECQKAGQDKLDVAHNLNMKYSDQSKTGRRGVRVDTYRQHLVEPTVYKVQPVDVQEFTCPDVEDGFFRDNVFCDIFHRCVLGKKFTFTCPAGTFFRLEETLCDFWEAVSGCTKDGIRLEALGSLPDVAALSHQAQQQVPEQFDLSIVNIDADPIGCPASGGLFPHPRNCRQFVFCSRFVPLVLTCPEPLLFNSQTLTCDFATKVHCFRSNDYRRK